MPQKTYETYVANLLKSGLSMHDIIDPDDTDHYIPNSVLEQILNNALVGVSLAGIAPRTRSKVVKTIACEALGYAVPKSFKKVQPRFTGQNFDTYNQQALNLQVWNELLDPERRYALIRIAPDHIVRKVRVVLGVELIPLDKTGTVTTKFQASLDKQRSSSVQLETDDSAELTPFVVSRPTIPHTRNPSHEPVLGELFSIKSIGEKLLALIGQTFLDTGREQDRNRGEGLHRLVCQALGYHIYGDSGQFPDVRHQLLEVKLQTSPTIDLGKVLPSSKAPLDVASLGSFTPRHCDTRYAVFYGDIRDGRVHITALHLITGGTFFNTFRQFGGLKVNGKRQMLLPKSLFGE